MLQQEEEQTTARNGALHQLYHFLQEKRPHGDCGNMLQQEEKKEHCAGEAKRPRVTARRGMPGEALRPPPAPPTRFIILRRRVQGVVEIRCSKKKNRPRHAMLGRRCASETKEIHEKLAGLSKRSALQPELLFVFSTLESPFHNSFGCFLTFFLQKTSSPSRSASCERCDRDPELVQNRTKP